GDATRVRLRGSRSRIAAIEPAVEVGPTPHRQPSPRLVAWRSWWSWSGPRTADPAIRRCHGLWPEPSRPEGGREAEEGIRALLPPAPRVVAIAERVCPRRRR